MDFKKDFPIFQNNNNLIYLDNGASAQRPFYVIDKVRNLYENDYANIHRGAYSISENSETLYQQSKQKVADFIGADSSYEIIYTYNSTYAINLLTQSLKKSNKLKKGDKVLLSIVEHHANIVPWLILKEEIGIELEFVNILDDYNLDMEDFLAKYDDKVKAVSMTYVSNVTGQIFDLESVGKSLRDDTLFIVDASQALPHFSVDVKKLNCDFLFFTGHKLMADTGIGVLWGKKQLLKTITPAFSGGGAIGYVEKDSYTNAGLPYKFEPGTPNIGGAVSLLAALEYIQKIGGYEVLEKKESELIKYFLDKLLKFDEIQLLGSKKPANRLGVFSLFIPGINNADLTDFFAEYNICVRSGYHCAEPFFKGLKCGGTCRVSLYLYNDKKDIDLFFEILKKGLEILKK